MRSVYDALAGAGAAPRFVGVKLGGVKPSDGAAVEIEATLETMPSPLWDAVVADASADALAKVGMGAEFVKEQFRHCKSMLILGDAPNLLAAAGIAADGEAPSDAGFVQGAPGDSAAISAFIEAVGRHKHYEREKDPSPV